MLSNSWLLGSLCFEVRRPDSKYSGLDGALEVFFFPFFLLLLLKRGTIIIKQRFVVFLLLLHNRNKGTMAS